MTTTEHMAAVILRLARRLTEVRKAADGYHCDAIRLGERTHAAEAKLRDCEGNRDAAYNQRNATDIYRKAADERDDAKAAAERIEASRSLAVAELAAARRQRDAEKARADKAEQTATAQWEHGRTMAEQLVVANARAADLQREAERLTAERNDWAEREGGKAFDAAKAKGECERLRGIIGRIVGALSRDDNELNQRSIIRSLAREADAPPAAICSHAVERDIDPVLTGEWPPKPRRMKENPAMNGFGEHGIEHDEQRSCPYGDKCEPVDAEARP